MARRPEEREKDSGREREREKKREIKREKEGGRGREENSSHEGILFRCKRDICGGREKAKKKRVREKEEKAEEGSYLREREKDRK